MKPAFWDKWLVTFSFIFVLFGTVAALFPSSFLFEVRNEAIEEVFFSGKWTPDAMQYHRFSMGPLGGTIAGFYILQLFIASVPFKKREKWSFHAILWGTIIWFVIDSVVSIAHGAFFNVYLINIFPLVVFGLPLAATYREFFKKYE